MGVLKLDSSGLSKLRFIYRYARPREPSLPRAPPFLRSHNHRPDIDIDIIARQVRRDLFCVYYITIGGTKRALGGKSPTRQHLVVYNKNSEGRPLFVPFSILVTPLLLIISKRHIFEPSAQIFTGKCVNFQVKLFGFKSLGIYSQIQAWGSTNNN
jgi:hypothetical protein